jgi:myosin heavy subunit
MAKPENANTAVKRSTGPIAGNTTAQNSTIKNTESNRAPLPLKNSRSTDDEAKPEIDLQVRNAPDAEEDPQTMRNEPAAAVAQAPEEQEALEEQEVPEAPAAVQTPEELTRIKNLRAQIEADRRATWPIWFVHKGKLGAQVRLLDEEVLPEMRSMADTITTLTQSNTTLSREKIGLQRDLNDKIAELNAANTARTTAMEERDEAIRERDTANAEITKLKALLETARQEKQRTDDALAEKKKELTTANATIKQLAAGRAADREAIKKLTLEIEKLRSEYDANRATIQKLNNQLNAQREEHAAEMQVQQAKNKKAIQGLEDKLKAQGEKHAAEMQAQQAKNEKAVQELKGKLEAQKKELREENAVAMQEQEERLAKQHKDNLEAALEKQGEKMRAMMSGLVNPQAAEQRELMQEPQHQQQTPAAPAAREQRGNATDDEENITPDGRWRMKCANSFSPLAEGWDSDNDREAEALYKAAKSSSGTALASGSVAPVEEADTNGAPEAAKVVVDNSRHVNAGAGAGSISH